MLEGRLEEIKERLEGHDCGVYHDASDMAVGFGEVVSEALELVEELERLRAALNPAWEEGFCSGYDFYPLFGRSGYTRRKPENPYPGKED